METSARIHDIITLKFILISLTWTGFFTFKCSATGEKIALTNGAYRSQVRISHLNSIFNTFRTCKITKNLVNQHDTGEKYHTMNSKIDRTVSFLRSIFLVLCKFIFLSFDRSQGTAG